MALLICNYIMVQQQQSLALTIGCNIDNLNENRNLMHRFEKYHLNLKNWIRYTEGLYHSWIDLTIEEFKCANWNAVWLIEDKSMFTCRFLD